MPADTNPAEPTSGPNTAIDTVERFLFALQDSDLDTALSLVDDDLEYTNVSLPTLHGKRALDRAFRPLLGRAGFRVHFHHVAAEGDVVLTERTDALVLGPVTWQFWVYGRFELVDERITVWRDSFDWGDLLIGLVRGVAALRFPALARRWPA